MELEREIKPYEVPSKVNCSIRLIAHGPQVHFDTYLKIKSSQVGVDSGITCAQHRSNKAAGCFAKYYVVLQGVSVFYSETTSTLGTLLTMPT